MTTRDRIFPTFILSGFECSTFVWKGQGRRDLVDETQHRQHAAEDYRLLSALGIGAVREGIPFYKVDQGGRYDFSSIDPMIAAMNAAGVVPIWDLFHYGYPDDADPLDDAFPDRFARYCRAAAQYVTARTPGPYFFTPINEITFFAFAGGQNGDIAPYLKGRDNRDRLRMALCRAAIAGVEAIRAVEPSARMVHVDPMVNIVAPRDRPDLMEAARRETYEHTPFAWDVLAGRLHPELGGSPEILDIVGVSHYVFSQMEYREDLQFPGLPPDDDRFLPLSSLLGFLYDRYHRPLIVAETSGFKEGRIPWFRTVMEEAGKCLDAGVDLQGVCFYPAVDMPDWYNGKWLRSGFYDIKETTGDLRRVPATDYIAELRAWQGRLAAGPTRENGAGR